MVWNKSYSTSTNSSHYQPVLYTLPFLFAQKFKIFKKINKALRLSIMVTYVRIENLPYNQQFQSWLFTSAFQRFFRQQHTVCSKKGRTLSLQQRTSSPCSQKKFEYLYLTVFLVGCSFSSGTSWLTGHSYGR